MYYLNSGGCPSQGYPGNRSLFPYVEIEWENNQPSVATLLQWDERQQKPKKIDET